jgi:fumarate hydratase subunit alpha
MREIHVQKIIDTVAGLVIKACINLPDDITAAFETARQNESSVQARQILDILLENAELAAQKKIPVCQDTGVAVVFVELGADIRITGGLITDAINEGIRQGTRKGYLRNSIVNDPLRRVNTGDNTPAVVFIFPVPGDRLHITVAPKGAGCENMSKSAMLKPADGREGIISFVTDTVCSSGANACPPLVVGVGIGGDFSYSAILAKKAFLRPVGRRNPDPLYAELEEELRDTLNSTGIGPQALGGDTTVLDIFIETAPCHIASLPVAVCINCHATRHAAAEF